MANDFKRYTKADVGTGTGTSGSTLYTVASTGSVAMEAVCIGIYLSNKTTTGGLAGCLAFLSAASSFGKRPQVIVFPF